MLSLIDLNSLAAAVSSLKEIVDLQLSLFDFADLQNLVGAGKTEPQESFGSEVAG